MSQITFGRADVERLAATLEKLGLDENDQAVLRAIFALAGQSVSGEIEDEVSGFTDEASPAFFSVTGGVSDEGVGFSTPSRLGQLIGRDP